MIDASEQANSATPSELTGPTPRKVQLNWDGGDTRFVLLIVLLFFVGGSIFLGWICNYDVKQFRQRALLRSGAFEVDGVVTGFAIRKYAPVGVFYKFVVNGVTYSNEALEPNNPMPGSALSKGDALPVRFLPSDPQINHPAAWEWSAWDAWYTTVLVVGAVVIGALILAALLRERKLARLGKAALGVVVGCTRDGRLFRAEYEFHTDLGISMRGKHSSPEELGAGQRIWVIYLPQKPRRNSRYPLDFFEVAESVPKPPPDLDIFKAR
jgi:hypothetical protein